MLGKLEMYQVVVRYLDGRFSCFFSDKPLKSYADFTRKVKQSVPYTRSIPDSNIRVAYKDISLGVFIAIAQDDDLVLAEAFRNAYDCGAENFRRLEIEIREIDSPLVAKNRRGRSHVKESDESATSSQNYATQEESSSTTSYNFESSHKKLNFDKESVTNDWKETKVKTLNREFQNVHDEIVAVDAQIDELSRNVTEPPPEGNYKSIICGNCHLRGHRVDGNKNNTACTKAPCISYISCGQRKKHPEHFDEVKRLKKRRKQLQRGS